MDQTGSPSAPGTRWVHRTTWALLILASLALLGSSVYRAATLAFGHDEAVSFAVFTSGRFSRTANHHPVNTTLMRWCSMLFGNSELSLRLPNVLAHALYLLSALALVRRLRGPLLQVLGFVLLTLNLFLAEYFFAARGYGLALAFELLSLYLFVRGYEETRHRTRDLYLAVVAGSLSVLSHFAFLNYYLPLVLACGWVLLTDASLRRISRGRIGATLVLCAGSGLFLSYVLTKLLKLQRDRQLYFGGRDGFVDDTVYSLVHCSLRSTMGSTAAVKAISATVVAMFVLLLALGIRQVVAGKREATCGVLVLLLAAAVALPIVEHLVFGALFPIERAALYYLPLYAIAVVCGLGLLRGGPTGKWRSIVTTLAVTATAVAVGWQFGRGFVERSSCAWRVDSHNREVLDLIARDRARSSPAGTVTLRASRLMEPSLNFYRLTRNYTWLRPVTRKPISRSDTDYIYTFEADLDSLSVDGDTRLASYPDLGTVLLRVDHADRP